MVVTPVLEERTTAPSARLQVHCESLSGRLGHGSGRMAREEDRERDDRDGGGGEGQEAEGIGLAYGPRMDAES